MPSLFINWDNEWMLFMDQVRAAIAQEMFDLASGHEMTFSKLMGSESN